MKLISLTICRNSQWSLEAVIESALRWCDEAVILDHASEDNTPRIIARLALKHPGRVTADRVDDPEWFEMEHRQRTLELGRALGGTHFAIIDDDEILTENLVGTPIRNIVEAVDPGVCVHLPWLCLWRSLDAYRSDNSQFGTSYKALAFADAPELCWHTWNGGYEHHHTDPWHSRASMQLRHAHGGLMHFQHANWRRLLAKQALYQAQEIVRWGSVRANYRGTVSEVGLQTTPIPPSWWGPEKPLIKLEEEPWQEKELKRIVAEHGRERFQHCDFFGVV